MPAPALPPAAPATPAPPPPPTGAAPPPDAPAAAPALPPAAPPTPAPAAAAPPPPPPRPPVTAPPAPVPPEQARVVSATAAQKRIRILVGIVYEAASSLHWSFERPSDALRESCLCRPDLFDSAGALGRTTDHDEPSTGVVSWSGVRGRGGARQPTAWGAPASVGQPTEETLATQAEEGAAPTSSRPRWSARPARRRARRRRTDWLGRRLAVFLPARRQLLRRRGARRGPGAGQVSVLVSLRGRELERHPQHRDQHRVHAAIVLGPVRLRAFGAVHRDRLPARAVRELAAAAARRASARCSWA